MKPASRSRMVAVRTAFALACAALLTPTAFGASGPSHCSTAQLRLHVASAQGAMGRRYIDYALGNASASSCTLRGYPNAVVLDRHGHAVATSAAKVSHWSLSKVRTVAIGPGARAFFSVVWTDGAFCTKPFSFYSMRISAPNTTAGFVHHLGRTPTCNRSVHISAVRPRLNAFSRAADPP